MTAQSLDARIATVRKLLDDCEAYLQELRTARPFDGYVVGYDWGMFLAAERSPCLVGILRARKFASRTVARDHLIRNRKGELARTMRHEDALAISIGKQEDLHTFLCGGLQDLYAEGLADYMEGFREAEPEGTVKFFS